jgi:hypothetical protein
MEALEVSRSNSSPRASEANAAEHLIRDGIKTQFFVEFTIRWISTSQTFSRGVGLCESSGHDT